MIKVTKAGDIREYWLRILLGEEWKLKIENPRAPKKEACYISGKINSVAHRMVQPNVHVTHHSITMLGDALF